MFCGNCGAKVNTGSAFCYNCGSRLAEPGQMAQMQQLPPQGQVNNEGWQAQSDNWQQQTGQNVNTGGSGVTGYFGERQKYVNNARQNRTRIMANGHERTSWGNSSTVSSRTKNRVFMGGQSRYRAPEGKKVEQLQSRNRPYTGYERYGVPQPGWSDRINDPEINSAMKKSKGIGKIAAFFAVPLPFIGFLIYSTVSDDMSIGMAVGGGLFVSFVFLIFVLVGMWQSSSKRDYEGIVIDKYEQEERGNEDGRGGYSGRLIGVTVVRTNEGKTKKIRESEGTGYAWDYLEIGAQFRYHAELPGFSYERYDKAKYPYLYCVACRTKNPIEEDRCSRCGLPLLK